MSEPLLSAQGLRKTYRMGRVLLRVLGGCDLQVASGEFVAIMGKSGSGKSTLLHILGALDAADEGEVYFAGEPIHRSTTPGVQAARQVDGVLETVQRVLLVTLLCWLLLAFAVFIVAPLIGLLTELVLRWWPDAIGGRAAAGVLKYWPHVVGGHLVVAAVFVAILLAVGIPLIFILFVRLFLLQVVERRRTFLRRHVFGFVFQFYHLLPELDVLENVLVARQAGTSTWHWRGRRAAARADALSVLQRVGLGERLKHKPNELSGGERQRVAIARALVHRPRILFADEPTGNLDAEAGASLMKLLKGLHAEGQTIVMVTHDPGIAAQADRTLLLESGRLRGA